MNGSFQLRVAGDIQTYENPYVVTPKTITLTVKPNDTIQKMKALITDKTGLPTECMRLKAFHKQLEDGRTLSDYGINAQHTIELQQRGIINGRFFTKATGTLLKHTPFIATCPDMKKGKSCSIYDQFVNNYKFSQSDLNHMQSYSHCGLNIKNCKYGVKCHAYVRLMNGGIRLDDQCHLTIFSHPPRQRGQAYEDLDSNVYEFIFGKGSAFDVNQWNVETKKEETKDDYNKYVKDWIYPQKYVEFELKKYEDKSDKNNALLQLLINEIKTNSDTTKKTSNDGNWKLDLVTEDGVELIDIVDKKYMNHDRHIKMGKPLLRAEMLSIVLYTGCECNYDLCKSQRTGDYRTWPVFDYCLNNALQKLSVHEEGKYAVYTGVGQCQIDFKKMKQEKRGPGYYMTTFVSTSYDINIAKFFLDMNGGGGTIIGFAPNTRLEAYAADVSWISKFGAAEKEILFARLQPVRGNRMNLMKFQFVDNIKKIQRVRAAFGGQFEKVFN